MGLLGQPRPPSGPLHLSLLWVAWTNLPSPLTSTPATVSLLWVAWTNLAPPHVHSTYLFYGSLGPTSPTHVCVPDMSILSTRVWVQHGNL
eukprot:1591843-Prymnesium_polylepis.1